MKTQIQSVITTFALKQSSPQIVEKLFYWGTRKKIEWTMNCGTV